MAGAARHLEIRSLAYFYQDVCVSRQKEMQKWPVYSQIYIFTSMALQWKCLSLFMDVKTVCFHIKNPCNWTKLHSFVFMTYYPDNFFVLKSVCLRVSNMIMVGLAYLSKGKLCKNTVGLWCHAGAAGCRDALYVNRHMHTRHSNLVWPRTRAVHTICVSQTSAIVSIDSTC